MYDLFKGHLECSINRTGLFFVYVLVSGIQKKIHLYVRCENDCSTKY